MTYDRQILEILTEVGDRGISVQLMSMHLYNRTVSLFSSQDLNEIKAYVRQYFIRNTKSSQSLIERTDRRGYYRLNTGNNADARQLMLEFKNPQKPIQEDSDSETQPDLSLDLFA